MTDVPRIATGRSGSVRSPLSFRHGGEALLQPPQPRLLPAQRVRDLMQVPFGLRIGGLDQPSFEPIDLAAQLPRLAVLDRRLRQRLSRGQTGVDKVIDLHGLRQHEAHSALYHFLARAQGEGAKLVLVVTGKGEGRQGDYGEYGGGVLRRAVPMWLRAPDWRSLVIGFEEASRPHGGAGALYVRLRRHGRAER